MQNPESLPQFKKTTALLLVVGAHAGTLFLAKDGRTERVHEFEEERPSYSDREGFFVQSGGGKVLASGAVYEEPREEWQARFLKEVAQTLSRVDREIAIDELYLFAPEYLLPSVKRSLTAALVSKIKREVAGNFTKEHPTKLLSRVRVAEKDAKEATAVA